MKAMTIRFKKQSTVSIALGLALGASAAMAGNLVAPVRATCQSFYFNGLADRRDAMATIDGSGLTLPVTAASPHSNMAQFNFWLSNGTKQTWIAFDLGCEMTLSGMHLWNYNELRNSNSDFFKRGIKTCVLRTGTTMPDEGMSYANAGSWGVAAETLTLPCATGLTSYTGEDVTFSSPVTTRYVMFLVMDNYGIDNYTGISEVRFYSNTLRTTYLTGESSSGAFPVSAGDLLQTAVTSVDDSSLVIDTANNDGYSKGTLASLTDGTFGAAGHADGLCISHGYVTYNLDTDAMPAGYDIGEVAVYTGWGGPGNGREHSMFSLLYKLVGEEDFRYVGSARYQCKITSGNRDTCVRMKGLGLTGVAAVRIDFGPDDRSQYYYGDVYKEIDVFPMTGRPVSPVAATAQSYYSPDDRSPFHAVDGTGMSPAIADDVRFATAWTEAENAMWLSNGTLDTWIAFDLGEEREITGFHLWNYNEYSYNTGKWQNRSIKTADVYVGTTMPANGGSYANAGAAWGTLVESMTFARAPSAGTYTGEDYAFSSPVRGRYFQFKVTSSYAGAAPSNYSDSYVGIAEIVFYERATRLEVTRLASGRKSIADSQAGEVVVLEGTSGAASPITLESDTVHASVLRTAMNVVYGEVPQIALDGKTLALSEIDLAKGSKGLEIMPGTLTCLDGWSLWKANWMKWNAEADLAVNAKIAANASGAVNVLKSGDGLLTMGGASSQIGTLQIEDGALVISGGETEVKELALLSDYPSVFVDGNATLKVGSFTGTPIDFDLAIDGGTLGTSALGTGAPWISGVGKIRIGAGGATFNTAGGSVVLEGMVTNRTGAIRKTGANALTLARRVAGTNSVKIAEGTLSLSLPAPIIHYDFDTISGTTMSNLGTGGTRYNGVISGSPTVVEGVGGNAFSFSANTQAVVTANAVPLRHYTYAAWVKSAGAYSQASRIIIGGDYESRASGGLLGYLGTDRKNHFWVFPRNVGRDDVPTSGLANSYDDTENWHHIATTYDGNTVTLYIDGELAESHAVDFYGESVCTVKIGFGNNINANSAEYCNGAMDEAYVFDRALSPDEVAMLKENSWKAVNVFDPNVELSIAAGATLDLDGVDQTVETLTLGGRLMRKGETTWGAIGSGAEHETAQITGAGILRVKGPVKPGFMIIVK